MEANRGNSLKRKKTEQRPIILLEGISRIKYFYGGGYPPPDAPNWYIDLDLNVNPNGSVESLFTESENPDPTVADADAGRLTVYDMFGSTEYTVFLSHNHPLIEDFSELNETSPNACP